MPYQTFMIALIIAITLSCGFVQAQTADGEVYEMRTYTTNDGKLDALHQRFREHTMRIFTKHGMGNVAYWIPSDTPNTLIYVISHASREAAQSNWQAFVQDPEWQAVYAASIADGELVKNIDSVFMTKTDYSP